MEVSPQVLSSMDVMKDKMADIAGTILKALDDNRIDWKEGLEIGFVGYASYQDIIRAFKSLEKEDIEVLIHALRKSDLVIRDREVQDGMV